MLADRLRLARLAAGLTRSVLGNMAGVPYSAIQQYEKGLLTPSSSRLLKLARACGVRSEYFFRSHPVSWLQAEYHSLANLSKKARLALGFKVLARVEKHLELLVACAEWPLSMPAFHTGQPERPWSQVAIDTVLDGVRRAWLGRNPVADLTGLLNTSGVLGVVLGEEQPGFLALAAVAQTPDGRMYPVVAVCRDWAGDRGPLERVFAPRVLRALAEQTITESKAAELLGMPMMRLHKEQSVV